MSQTTIDIYTDGSCHTALCTGAWAAILLVDNKKTLLQGEEKYTTHNRMELLAAIKAIEFTDKNWAEASLTIYTDSQYVFRIRDRKEKLKANHFITKKRTPIQNCDLVKTLIQQIETHSIDFVKVKAHQKPELTTNSPVNYNREVDKIVREMVRERVKG